MSGSIEADEVSCSIWWATPRFDVSLVELLSAPERDRAARLHGRALARFVTSRALARVVLSKGTELAPSAIPFDATCRRCGGEHGKPRIAAPGAKLAFNVAHTDGWIVVAVTEGPEVGVDVELVRDLAPQQLAELSSEILTREELAAYARLPPGGRARALARWWTRKEAVLKATGEGLATAPSSVTVTDPTTPPAVLAWHAPDWPPGRVPRVLLEDLVTEPSLVASVAVLTARTLRVREQDGNAELSARAQREVRERDREEAPWPLP